MSLSEEKVDPILERSFRGHKGCVNDISFNPNVRQLASCGNDKMVMIWNFKQQLRAFKFVGHKSSVLSVNYSPSGKLLVTGSKDCTFRVWEANVMGKVLFSKSHSNTVRNVIFSNDNKYVLSVSDDKTAKVMSIYCIIYILYCFCKQNKKNNIYTCLCSYGMLVQVSLLAVMLDIVIGLDIAIYLKIIN